jgi:hypothetical protein
MAILFSNKNIKGAIKVRYPGKDSVTKRVVKVSLLAFMFLGFMLCLTAPPSFARTKVQFGDYKPDGSITTENDILIDIEEVDPSKTIAFMTFRNDGDCRYPRGHMWGQELVDGGDGKYDQLRLFRYAQTSYQFHIHWYVVESDDKRRARLNCISHLLSVIPYEDLTPEPMELPPRQEDIGYERPPISYQTCVPEKY